MCSVIMPRSSICGVTSSTMPEKYGWNSGDTVAGVATLPIVGGVTVTFETKSSSCPTLSTAFWLLIVATRGLESTCTLPCRSEEHTSELQSRRDLVCRLLLEKKKKKKNTKKTR